jgi:hypothetical protein
LYIFSIYKCVIPISSTGEKIASHFILMFMVYKQHSVSSITSWHNTKSNISIPRAIFSKIFIEFQRQITWFYLLKNWRYQISVIAYISSQVHPDNPPNGISCWLNLQYIRLIVDKSYISNFLVLSEKSLFVTIFKGNCPND